MYLVVNDLITSIEQQITTVQPHDIGAIRLYLLKELSPTGSLTLSILKGSDVIFTEEKTIASIIAASDLMTETNYFHGFLTWELSARLERETTYTIKLEGTDGYTSGISWVKEYINPTNNSTFDSFLTAPHSIQLWSRKGKGMIRILDFTDGFTSASAPDGTSIALSGLELSFDDYIYHRQVSGEDTSGDWRIKTTAGVYSIEEYDGADWVEKSGVLS
jgi:hypothetical protein